MIPLVSLISFNDLINLGRCPLVGLKGPGYLIEPEVPLRWLRIGFSPGLHGFIVAVLAVLDERASRGDFVTVP
jgi:hypothetical protein